MQGHTHCHTAGQSRQEEDLKSSHGEKRTVLQETQIRMMSDFSSAVYRTEGSEKILTYLKGKKKQQLRTWNWIPSQTSL